MSKYELQQIAGLVAGSLVLLGIIVSVVRWSRAIDAIFPDAATKYGLTYARKSVGSYFTGKGEHLSLRGQTQGVTFDVLARRERTGRYRRQSTTITAAVTLPVTPCTMTLSRARSLHPMHLVSTGDTWFDTVRFVTCDAPETVRMVLTPLVREALLKCPQDELRLTITGDQVVMSWTALPMTAVELQAPIDVVLALATEVRSVQTPPGAPDTRDARTAAVPADAAAALARTFGFTSEQLDANRQGRLHPAQRARVAGQDGGVAVGFLIVAVLCAVAGIAGGIYNYHDRMEPRFTNFAIPAGLGLALAGAFGVAHSHTLGERRARRAILGGDAPQVVEGAIAPWEIRGHGVPPSIGFTIGAHTFNSTRTWNALLTPGAIYRVYFVRDVVLSIEPLRTRGVDQ